MRYRQYDAAEKFGEWLGSFLISLAKLFLLSWVWMLAWNSFSVAAFLLPVLNYSQSIGAIILLQLLAENFKNKNTK